MSITPVLNEEQRIGAIIREMPRDWVEVALVVNDGSTDGTEAAARAAGAEVVSHPRSMGVGAAIRTGIHYALERGFDAVVVTSGSGKTRSSEVPVLLKALVDDSLDMAQGSRYIPGGHSGNMPLQRRIGTRGFSFCFSLFAGRWVADASSGFRAMRTSFLKDPRIRLDQDWLDKYELEPYLLYKVINLGYRMSEAPVTIEYPPPVPGVPYTRIRALVDWWRLLRPAVFLRLGLRG
ncbi:MAG: glycosyltransferase family 2 protein [Chloroflexi bacterium]|nr:glycosyltransferase family 2 protein [Chloroflexota bacterium]